MRLACFHFFPTDYISRVWEQGCMFCSLQLMIRNVDEKQVMKVVLPHLVKLAKDSEM